MKTETKIREFVNSYTGQMSLGILLINLVLIPLLFMGIYFLVGQDYKAQFINYVRTHSFQLAMQLSEKPAPENIERILEDLVLSGQVVYADYEIDGSHIKPALIDKNIVFNEDFTFGGDGDNIYFVSAKTAGNVGGSRGTLRLGFDELPIMEHINTAYLRGAYIAIAYIVLTLILVGSFGHFLSQSIRRLRDASYRIASGHTSTELTIKTRISEVSNLAQDLEVMRRELVRREHEISQREMTQRDIVENAAEGIITVDEQYRIQSFNTNSISKRK